MLTVLGMLLSATAAATAGAWSADVASIPHLDRAHGAVAFIDAGGDAVLLDAETGQERWRRPPPPGVAWQDVAPGGDGVILRAEGMQALAAWDDGELRWSRALPEGMGLFPEIQGGLTENYRFNQQQRLARAEDGAPISPMFAGNEIHEWGLEPGEVHATYYEPAVWLLGTVAGHSLLIRRPPREEPVLELWPPHPAEAPLWSRPQPRYPAGRHLGGTTWRAGEEILRLDASTAAILWHQPLPSGDDCLDAYVAVRPLPGGRLFLVDGCAEATLHEVATGREVARVVGSGEAVVVLSEEPGTPIGSDVEVVTIIDEEVRVRGRVVLPSGGGERAWAGAGAGVLVSSREAGARLYPVGGGAGWRRTDLASARPMGGWIAGYLAEDRGLVLVEPGTGVVRRHLPESVALGATASGAVVVHRSGAGSVEVIPAPASAPAPSSGR